MQTLFSPSVSCRRTATTSLLAVRNVLAHVGGLDRQLRVAAVDQGKELDARRTAELHHGVERSARGAAGVDHIVDQHNGLARDGEGNVGPVEHRRVRDCGQIVAVERDVQLADRQLHTVDLLDVFSPDGGQAARRACGCRSGTGRPAGCGASPPAGAPTVSASMR